MNNKNILLEINDLRVNFFQEELTCEAVRGVSFKVYEGETFGIVGESGSGKSVTCLAINQLIPYPQGKILCGEIIYLGKDLLKADIEEVHSLRGKEIAMIFQEPMTSLNPVLTIGNQMAEVLIEHQKLNRKDALFESINILKSLGVSDAEKRINDYPHQFSGGMRQRVMIGMSILLNPKLLIADEPTTALDVTIQAQILNLLEDIKEKHQRMSMILITHNLALISRMCDRLMVMYGGKIQEIADAESFFKEPKHPYSKALLKCIPDINNPSKELLPIAGNVPNINDLPKGCKFWPRCEKAMTKCKEFEPPLYEIEQNYSVRCFLYENSN